MSIGKALFILFSIARLIWILASRILSGFVSGVYFGVWVAIASSVAFYGFCYATGLDRSGVYVLPFGLLVWAVCVLGAMVLSIVTFDFKFAYADFMESLARKR